MDGESSGEVLDMFTTRVQIEGHMVTLGLHVFSSETFGWGDVAIAKNLRSTKWPSKYTT